MTEVAEHSPPKVTVLLPVHNSARFLREAMDSILAQTWHNFELLAIDDGSTDDGLEILRSYPDPRIRIVVHQQNRGLATTLNEGVELAKGEYIARMDGDDVMLPERLAEQVAYLDTRPEIALVASFIEYINVEGAPTGPWDTDRATPDEATIAAMLPRTNCLAHPSVMFRRSALRELRYAPRHGAEDWDLWLRMLSRGLRLAKIPKVLLRYRIHPGSITAIDKRTIPYERRLLHARWRFLSEEWSRGRFTKVHGAVFRAQMRTAARHLRNNVALPFLRGSYRLLTYSPLGLLRERARLIKVLDTWKGRHVFTFPYLSTGGAEQAHADIMSTVADQHPLIVIEGFSKDRGFAERYARIGALVEVPRLVHHPFTRRWTRRQLTTAINHRKNAVLLGANSGLFFELLPQLNADAQAFQLIHAFLYQPQGNVKHRSWLPLFPRVDRYLFVSQQAMEEYQKFLFANNVPGSEFGKLVFIPNAVHRFGEVRSHERTGLLFVGRDSPEKRLGLFLALADALEAEHPGRFRFTVVGNKPIDGHAHVRFTGTVNDHELMANLYADHDILTLTSSREGFPMVVMEAMANGLVVVATPVGDIPNRLDPSFSLVTSSVEATKVVDEMTATIVELDRERGRLQRMKGVALHQAQQEFDLTRLNERYRSLLMHPAS
ncbi:MAG: glycosyltransferase [Flavobacteriales bacterium]|jgi:glycosyltransferase involved in cell wall biosynthesis|nr:glycosyltransferase [Flavobacteriales bacterium]